MSLHPFVLILGDKPSNDNIDPSVAFVGSKSYKTLLSWIADMDLDIHEIKIMNTHNKKWEPTSWFPADMKIITLGKNATKRCLPVFGDKRHFELPHPSGLNRKLNDKKELKRRLAECKKFIYGY